MSSAHNQGVLSREDMKAKTNELAGGDHATSTTFGEVVSDYESDAAGNTPQDIAKADADRKQSRRGTKN